MNQWREQMKRRTHVFVLDVLEFLRCIPDCADTRELKDQLRRSASGVDLNWHAACRGRTHKEFTAKLGTVLEEADEAAECLALIRDGKLAIGNDVGRLSQESHELRLIFGKATRTARANEDRQARERQIDRRRTRKRV
ncbi:MAG: four helix bundle protein [Acidobacteria bacterium]|nr:four helix bundle protein [Acidobacteriota bacterium]